jgi:hypothetical protein
MLQTLHLDGATAPVAVLLEGPALRLRRPGTADVFAPLPALARITVHGKRVHWRAEATVACLEFGVPVVFLAERGTMAGVLVPARPPAARADLAGLLDLACTAAGFRGRLEDFCRAEQHRAAAAAAEAVGLGLDLPPGGRHARALAALAARSPSAESATAAARTLEALAAAVVATTLARRGVGPNFLARRTGSFPLPDQLGRVLALAAWPACLEALASARTGEEGALTPAARRALIEAFEASGPDGACDRLLARLAVRLASELG